MTTKTCSHSEGMRQDGETRIEGHDCDYVERRNALIPAAEQYACLMAGVKPPESAGDEAHAAWCDRWNRAFFRRMDEAWRAEERKHCGTCTCHPSPNRADLVQTERTAA